MSATKIEWTDVTWNPVTGCRKVSPGCAHCYAERLAPRVFAGQEVDTRADLTGYDRRPRRFTDVRTHRDRLDAPLRWRKPRRVFVNSMSDLFHEDVPYTFIREVFNVMRSCDGGVVAATGKRRPAHTFQVLTKRPERMWELARSRALGFDPDRPPPNVWLGVSVEDQQRADERVPILLDTPAAVRFVSCEPLLGPVDLGVYLNPLDVGLLDWIIVGGESGPGARPMDLAWARSLVEQGRAAGCPVFVKQLGARPYEVVHDLRTGDEVRQDYVAAFDGKLDRKGGKPGEWPPDLRVREFPS